MRNNKILDKLQLDKLLLDDKIESIDDSIFNNYRNNRIIDMTDLGISIKHNNFGAISKYFAKKNGVTLSDYKVLIQKIKKEKTLTKQKQIYYEFFMNIFNYNKATFNEMSMLIDKLVKLSEWLLVDYLHIFGYRGNDKKMLIMKCPDYLLNRYKMYGYDINDKIFYGQIKNSDEIIITKLNNDNYNEWKAHIFAYVRDDLLLKIINNLNKDENKSKESRLIAQDCMRLACKNWRFEIIKFLLNKNTKLEQENIQNLFGIEYNKMKKKKRRNRYIFRRYYQKYKCCENINFPINYEKNMIDIIANIKVEYKIKNGNMIYGVLIKNSFYDLIKKLSSFLGSIQITNYEVVQYVYNKIKNDDLDGLKKLISENIFKMKQGTNMTKYMDYSILNNSKKIIKFLNDELNVKCSNNIHSIYRHRIDKKNNMELLKNLESINYPINKKLLEFACTKCNYKWVKYLVEEKKIQPSKKLLTLSLYDGSRIILFYLLSKLNKKFKYNIDDFLRKICCKYKYRYYRSISFHNKIMGNVKFIEKYMGGKITDESLKYALNLANYELFLYLHKKYDFKLKKHLLAENYRYRVYGKTDIFKIYEYILDNISKDEISLDEINKIMDKGYEFGVTEILDQIEKIYNVPIDYINLLNFLSGHNDPNKTIRYVFEKKKYITIDEDLCKKILLHCNADTLFYIYNNYPNAIDFKNLLSKKNINTFIMYDEMRIEMLVFINKYFKENISPYTIELLIEHHGYLKKQILSLLLEQNFVITNKIMNYIKKKYTKSIQKQIISKLKVIDEFIPDPDELPNEGMVVHNIFDDDYEPMNEEDDVELAIKEAEEGLIEK